MQGRQQPGQEKRYFLEQEESTGYLPVFRNIRLEKNKNLREMKTDCSIHWCTGCHTLSTTTWMSQCWCLTGTLLVSSGFCWIRFLTKGLCRTHGWVALTTLAGWRSLDLIQVGNFIFWILCFLSIYSDVWRHRQGPTGSRWRSFQQGMPSLRQNSQHWWWYHLSFQSKWTSKSDGQLVTSYLSWVKIPYFISGQHMWRWTGFNSGLDLIVTYDSFKLTLKVCQEAWWVPSPCNPINLE